MLSDNTNANLSAPAAQLPGTIPDTLGAPGFNFRYVKTFGVTGKPYLDDTSHLNHARSVTAVGNGIWIGESWGFRAIQMTANGAVQRVIGNAGYEKYGDQIIQDVNDIAVDAQGNIWLALGQNQVVQYDSSGAFIKAIGQRWGGGSSNDRFQVPASIDFDSKGNLYVSDGAPWWDDSSGNQRIQIFDSSGNYLNTIGVTGEAGVDNQHLRNPRYIAIYADTLYVADSSNHRIQIFNVANPAAPAYQATIGVTGEAGVDNSHLDNPNGVMVTAAFIYVADTDNNRIQIFDRSTLTFVANMGGSWGEANDEFKHPSDVTVDAAGNIYVADFVNSRVQQFNANRAYSRTFGVTGVPYVTDGSHYFRPEGIAVAADGSLYIAEVNGKRIVKLNATGSPLWSIGQLDLDGGWSRSNDRFDSPVDIALDSKGRVYVADRWNNRIQIFDTNGNYQSSLTGITNGATVDNFNCPYGIATDRTDRLYVADSCNQRVVIFDAALNHLKTLGTKGESGADNAHFNEPSDVVINNNGDIYIADTRNDRVQRFNAAYTYLGTIGETGVARWSHEHFSSGIAKLAVDSKNRLFVADAWNNRVQVFDAGGAYRTTIGGGWGEDTSSTRGALGVAIDAQDNVYLVDAGNHRILKYEPRSTDNWTQSNINGFGEPQSCLISSHLISSTGTSTLGQRRG
ncbi:MAG: NHL repeat-containing protein [Caldilineaceae bacterium]